MFKLFDFFRKSRISRRVSPDTSIVHAKYTFFEKLLSSNNRSLELIANLENMIYQDLAFTFSYVLTQTELLINEVSAIVEGLNSLSGAKYAKLSEVTERIAFDILSELKAKKKIEETSLILPIENLSHERVAEVGGKAANLGEVYNRVHLPVPQGFAVTAYACHQFLEYNNLNEQFENKLKNLDVEDTEKLLAVSEDIRLQILEADLPDYLAQAISQAAHDLGQKGGREFRLAVRSSATSEDTEASFAGQHSTVLNVGGNNLIPAYKEVVSSTFNPRAIFYRRSRGYHDQDVIMSVACIVMVDARVSGIMYTVDPNDSRHMVIMISSLWGLAAKAVEGAAFTDFFQINKRSRQIEISEIATKQTQLRPKGQNGLKEEPLPGELKKRSSLDPQQVELLVEYALQLEKHYGYALDIEWAIDQDNKLYILQARPLRRSQRFGELEADPKTRETSPPLINGHRILLKGGMSASDGTAAGLAYVIKSDHALHHIPGGAILVTRNTSPRYVPLMGRIQAIITDVGSVTGHMASVAREFRIPTLVGTGSATKTIPHGQEITVDSAKRIVYQGLIEELLMEKLVINPMKGSPVYKKVQSVLKRIAPLNLIDPKRDDFRPDACQTMQDIIRFSHEMAMQEMFRISKDVETQKNVAIHLRVYLPMEIYIIDLGGGLSIDAEAQEATMDDVSSVPFKALLKGMTNKDVDWTRNAGMTLRGFASMLAESVVRDPMKDGPMGGANYAVVGGRYLNFNVRVGYHFATIDTYCGPEVNDNYINFYFKGGAADIGRRSRRAVLIATILKKMDFKVEQTADMVRGKIQKFERKRLEKKLDTLGRLLGAVNLLDRLLSDDGMIDWYADQFFKGNYSFQPEPD